MLAASETDWSCYLWDWVSRGPAGARVPGTRRRTRGTSCRPYQGTRPRKGCVPTPRRPGRRSVSSVPTWNHQQHVNRRPASNETSASPASGCHAYSFSCRIKFAWTLKRPHQSVGRRLRRDTPRRDNWSPRILRRHVSQKFIPQIYFKRFYLTNLMQYDSCITFV